MDILQTAIEVEGSAAKLARALDINQNVISNWRARRLPKAWRALLALKYGKRKPRTTTTAEA